MSPAYASSWGKQTSRPHMCASQHRVVDTGASPDGLLHERAKAHRDGLLSAPAAGSKLLGQEQARTRPAGWVRASHPMLPMGLVQPILLILAG